MIYTKDITITANTTEASPKEDTIISTVGTIYLFSVHFPPGCEGLARFKVYVGGHQVLPSTQGMSFRGDAATITFKENIVLAKAFNKIRVKSWNLDEYHDHTITIMVGVLRDDVLKDEHITSRLDDLIEAIVGGVGTIAITIEEALKRMEGIPK